MPTCRRPAWHRRDDTQWLRSRSNNHAPPFFAYTIVEKEAGGLITACPGGETMSKRLVQFGSAFMLWTLLPALVFAGGFQANIFCFVDAPPGEGKGRIGGNGTGQFHVQGLSPNETFTCAVDCVVLGDSVAQSCTSDAQGDLDVTLEQVPDTCLGAVFAIKQDTTILCASGFVLPLPIIPHP